MIRSALVTAFLAVLTVAPCAGGPLDISNGWRGNGTGLWPDARVPLRWHRPPQGVMADLRTQPNRPADKDELEPKAARIVNGQVRDWLVLGPIAVVDSVRDFNKAQWKDETTGQPNEGDRAGGRVWKKMAAQLDDRWDFGPARIPVADLTSAVGGFQRNQVAYAHTYLFAPRGGTIRAVVEHAHGLKAWLNGQVVYSEPQRSGGMGNYYAFSRVELGIYDLSFAPRIDLVLKPGWNRLLFKVSTYNKPGWTDQQFSLRLQDLPTVPYASENILWMTELPHRSNATPLVVGDRVFIMSEPDELLCLDKHTGKILWTAANSYYETLTPAERQANPAFQAQIEPLLVELKKESNFVKRQQLRTTIQRTLTKIDPARFAWKADGHFEAHFGIVGFTSPTPVSDGRHVWVWCGNGVAACYDLDGKRRWISRVSTEDLSYSSSPALADGTFAVFLHKLIGVDAQTGKVRWVQKKVNENMGSILAARIAGVPVFVTSFGHVVRASDGKLLYRERDRAGGASSWTAPVILGNLVYLPRYGVKHLLVLDFTRAAGEEWVPQRLSIEVPDGVGRRPDGRMVDRPTGGSPLVVDNLVYLVDIYGTLYVFDLKAKKMVYHRDTELGGLFHYNAVPVVASPVLVGNRIIIQDNQGTALVLEPGRTFRQLAKNHIATQMDHYWPIPGQETVGYAPLVPDGQRMYLRGERYLYCIGSKGTIP
jgi:outer membrane protein assembly factor BamB